MANHNDYIKFNFDTDANSITVIVLVIILSIDMTINIIITICLDFNEITINNNIINIIIIMTVFIVYGK